MKHLFSLTLIAACASLAPAVAEEATDLERFKEPEGMPLAVGEHAQISDQRGEELPLDLLFDNEVGEKVALRDLIEPGRPVLLQFVYYSCPSLCTVALNGTSELLGRMKMTPGREFTLITVSINPREGPNLARGKKRAYLDETYPDDEARRETAAAGWHFLTGVKDNIEALAGAAGFGFRFDFKTREFAHGAGLFVLTPEGVISRVLHGVKYIAQTTRLSLVEAADGKIGTATDQVLLFCYRFDPDTGKYTAQIMTITRVIAFGLVFGLAALITYLFRFERARMRRLEAEQETQPPASPGAAS